MTAPPGAPPAPVVEFRSVGLTYPGPPAVEALRPCDLTVEQGEYITVVGPSGAGKSTFLNIVGLLDTPTGGRYLLDGIDTAALTEGQRSSVRGSRVGFVFQSFHLLPHRSARENVEVAMLYQRTPRRQRRVRAEEALGRVGLSHRADSLPTRLSGGERQRVAIARALASRPALLLCDEPTGNLDSDTAASVLDLIGALHRDGMTILMITHDPQVAARAERTITIRDGLVVQEPEPAPARSGGSSA